MNTNRAPEGFRKPTLKMEPHLQRAWGVTAVWMLSLFLLLRGVSAQAGEELPPDLKQASPPSLEEPWKFTLGIPGWMPGIYGTIGINGITSPVSVDFGQIFPRINFATSVEAGVQKGKLGFLGSLFYTSLGGDVGRDGLLSKIDLRVDEYIADIGVSYRVIEGRHGWVDALAGCRYTNLYQRVTLHPDYDAIGNASTQLVDAISQRILQELSDRGIGDQLKGLIAQKILDRLGELDEKYPGVPIGPVGGGDIDRIRDSIQQIVDKLDPALVTAVQAAAQAKTAALKAAAQQRIAYLKNKLANAIASRIGSLLNQSAAKTNYWFDPYVGLRGRLNLGKAFYLIGKSDIGGFGVGSQLTWQAYGALGCQITRNIYAETGYRCLFDNYRDHGLTYDVFTRGIEVNMGVTF